MSWGAFQEAEPDLARYGAERLHGAVAYLATVRRDGTPRLHPVTPIIGAGRLFLFMEPASPKGRDLRRGSGYVLHSSVADTSGGGGEFSVRGHAQLIEDSQTREIAMRNASYRPADRFILFELSVEGAASTVYDEGRPIHRRWGNA